MRGQLGPGGTAVREAGWSWWEGGRKDGGWCHGSGVAVSGVGRSVRCGGR